MICRLCLNTLDEQNAVLLFASAAAATECNNSSDNNKQIPENYLVHLISTHLYLCLSRDDAISTSICTDCCAQLESFHNFWKLVELKQTTLCSQFLEIDCDVNWSEEGDVVEPLIEFKQEPLDVELEAEREATTPTAGYEALLLVKDETEFHESYLKSTDHKVAVAAGVGVGVGANKFPCMFCEKSFKMRRYLEEHVATHTGDRPIACAYCNTAFRCRSNMYTHVKTKHNTQWQKARAERDAAKVNSNNNNNNNNNSSSQANSQRSVNGAGTGGGGAAAVAAVAAAGGDSDKEAVPPPLEQVEAGEATQPQPVLIKIPIPPASSSASVPTSPPAAAATPVPAPTPVPISLPVSLPLSLCPAHEALPAPDKVPAASEAPEANEAINLTVNKPTTQSTAKRVTRASRRKTHSPKKVQHIERSLSASEDSSNEDVADLYGKRLKTELQTCKENELILANYNAVCKQQEHLLTAAMAEAVSSSSSGTATAPATTAAAAAANSEPTPPAAAAEAPAAPPEAAYTCSICGQQLRNQRALNNHLHNKHNASQSLPSLSLTVSICSSCGELAGNNHRCSSKAAKYTCDVCSKSFKMKRYLEEHFATHTGVKLHTCAFCPTEFRSKSNMYHHTKRKHKLEWERSRATRNAAKQQQQHPQQHPQQQSGQQEEPATNDNS